MTEEQTKDVPHALGSRLELFVDDWLIEQMSGASLKMHAPVPREIALELNRDWEGPLSYDPVVMKDGDRFRLWYRAAGLVWEDRYLNTGYAESDDGVDWHRPTLGIQEVDGSTQNNLVISGTWAKALCVFKDGNPNVPDSERYKATGLARVGGRGRMPADKRATIRAFTSPDGLHWRVLEEDPILVAPDDGWPMFDSHNISFWDTIQQQYVIYARGWIDPGVRLIRRSVSPDFRHWSELTFIDMGDAPTEHLYKNSCTQYFRAPHIYLMFPKRFVPERKFHASWGDDGLSESVFMTSRDGVHWDRRFMEAFLRPGLDTFNWSDRNMYIGVGVVPTSSTELSLYYLEHYKRPSCRLRRATLRTDGFVSVNAPYAGGELVTRPLTFEGQELVINYATSAVGSLSVEMQGVAGQPLEGYSLTESIEIFGDEIERVVAWQRGTDVSSLAGQPVRLRLIMKDADLYSIRFQ